MIEHNTWNAHPGYYLLMPATENVPVDDLSPEPSCEVSRFDAGIHYACTRLAGHTGIHDCALDKSHANTNKIISAGAWYTDSSEL